MDTPYIFIRYGILIDGSYNNEKKALPLNQAQIEHYNFQVVKAFEEILKRKTGEIIVEGIRSAGWYVVVMPFWYNTCNNGTNGRSKMVRGEAFRYVTEKGSTRKGPSNSSKSLKKFPEFDTQEDFFAVLITNIFASETGRPLRANHDDLKALPSDLSTDKGFLAVKEYVHLVRQFCSDHPSVSVQLRDVPSAFNPIRGVLVGQMYQVLLGQPPPDLKAIQAYWAQQPADP
jgi:hypothetical protein